MNYKNLIEHLLARNPLLYRLTQSLRSSPNPDKLIFSKFIKKGDIVIDCGANVGFYTNFIRSIVGNEGFVHAFEPVPNTFKKLSTNTKKYISINNYTLNNLGLYKKIGSLTAYIPDSIDGHASINNHISEWKADSIEEVSIKLTTLDTYFSEKKLKKIDFIKMDIEGAEIEALKGGKQTLSEHYPTLHLEVNSQLLKNFKQEPADLLDFLKTIGYKIFYYYDSNPNILNCFEHLIHSNHDINTNMVAEK